MKTYKKIVIGLILTLLTPPIGYLEASSTLNSKIGNKTSESNPTKNVYENDLETLFLAIYGVESGCDSTKINKDEMAVGGLQIRRVLLRDYYQRTGTRVLLYETYNLTLSKKIFMYYAGIYGPDHESIARCWNGGLNGMRKTSTIKYWNQVKKEIENLKK